MDRQKPNGELNGTPESIVIAYQIIEEELGEPFYLEYGELPKNVGIQGDARVYGDTVIIACEDKEALAILWKDQEKLERIATRLCNESFAVSKVILDILARPKSDSVDETKA